MSDTPYREPPPPQPPRPPRPDPLAEETENPPHVRAAGALLATNALLGVGIGAAQARAGFPVSMGVLVFAALLDIPIGFGLSKRAPQRVRPAGLRRLAAFRLVCGMGVALLGVRASPAATALSLCASLTCLVLLTRTVTRTRAAVSALAQVLVVLTSAWLLTWTERGQQLFWGAYLHARGEVGAPASGTIGGGSRPFSVEVPAGWYLDREEGASSDLRIVSPDWGGVFHVASVQLEWDSGPNTPEGLRRDWTDELDQRGVRCGALEPLEVDGSLDAVRCPLTHHGQRDWLYFVLKADGDVLVSAELFVPGGLHRAKPSFAQAMLRSLRPRGRSPAALASAADAPIAAVPPGGLALNLPGWTLHPPAGWWTLSPSTHATLYGANAPARGLTVPFTRTHVAVFVSDHFDVGEIEAMVRETQGVVRVTRGLYAAVPEAREFVGHGAEGEVLTRVRVVPRGGAYLVAMEFGDGMPERRARELADMLRAVTFPARPCVVGPDGACHDPSSAIEETPAPR